MTKERIDRLIDLSRQKNQLLNKMLEVTEKQAREIGKEDFNDLDLSIRSKDDIIKRIDKLDKSFLEIFSQIKKDHNIEDINMLDIDEYPNLKELKKEVKKLSSTLLTLSLLDKENNESIRRKLEKAQYNLKNIKKGRKAYKGYNYKAVESMLIDEKK